MSDPLADVVALQYEKWTYPEPVEDLEEFFLNNWQKFDPSHAHRILWPDREYKPDLELLVAGCGTNQAAMFAYNNRAARVVAIDISEASLAHEEHLKEKYGLTNLELHQLPIEELPTLGLDFDYIVSTGVLHHMADPGVGINALSKCLRADGAMGLMLYAKHGRTGVQLLQSVFRDLGLGQDERSIELVRKTIEALPPHHLVRGYLEISEDWHYDGGLVDTFLHGRERSYTVDDCIDFVESAGLVFQGWLDNAPYYPHPIATPAFALNPLYSELDDRTLWSLQERLWTDNGCHIFMACSPDRPKESYTVDFSTLDSLDYVPEWRISCGLSWAEIYRPDWRFRLDEAQLVFAQHVDGRRTIREIADAVRTSRTGPKGSRATVEKFARDLFQELWRLDFFAMGWGSSTGS